MKNVFTFFAILTVFAVACEDEQCNDYDSRCVVQTKTAKPTGTITTIVSQPVRSVPWYRARHNVLMTIQELISA